jgi:hypothetical protein
MTAYEDIPIKLSKNEVETLILRKMEGRMKLGWVDWSPFSFDREQASRRACRIVLRTRGHRTLPDGTIK